MAWLMVAGGVIVSLEVADGRRQRLRGLLGRDGIEGALLIRPARSVHTLGMRFDIDVAHVDAEMVVLRVKTMRRNRIGGYVPGARAVIEAEAGNCERWGISVGVELEVKQ